MTTVDYLIQTHPEIAKKIVQHDRQDKSTVPPTTNGKCASAYCNEPVTIKNAPYCSADCRRISQTA